MRLDVGTNRACGGESGRGGEGGPEQVHGRAPEGNGGGDEPGGERQGTPAAGRRQRSRSRSVGPDPAAGYNPLTHPREPHRGHTRPAAFPPSVARRRGHSPARPRAPCGNVRPREAKPAALAPLNRFPRMVQEWYVEQVRAAEKIGDEARAKLKTKADAEAYVADVREKIATCFGPFPEKTPLNAKVTGTARARRLHDREGRSSRAGPGSSSPRTCTLPKRRRTGKRPGVVGLVRALRTTARREPAYQSFCQGLARMGYVVLIFDPIGQGERLQYGHVEKPHRPGVGVGEHLLAGNQQFLVGEFFGSWRAWDGIRALDYLLSRPEVDPKHVGITGNSGGGTMTTWLCGVEPRWTMAAPGCFVTTFRRNLENELPQDTEQCPPHALALGLDHSRLPRVHGARSRSSSWRRRRTTSTSAARRRRTARLQAPLRPARRRGEREAARRPDRPRLHASRTARRCTSGSTRPPAFPTRRPNRS